MKEIRFFYDANAPASNELPDDEAMHALRVLRLKSGDEFMIMDGRGTYYRARLLLLPPRSVCIALLRPCHRSRSGWANSILPLVRQR